ncbi:MAG: hypothetical protein CMN05_07850 [Roseibacillus sp.]|nr:hypothetical protein [Roseibacillus sp.]MBP34550.1 hypothetical protein [Roseibacillus sp.]
MAYPSEQQIEVNKVIRESLILGHEAEQHARARADDPDYWSASPPTMTLMLPTSGSLLLGNGPSSWQLFWFWRVLSDQPRRPIPFLPLLCLEALQTKTRRVSRGSVSSIAARFNELKLETARGSMWPPMTIKRICDRLGIPLEPMKNLSPDLTMNKDLTHGLHT